MKLVRQEPDSVSQLRTARPRRAVAVSHFSARRRDERRQDADEGGFSRAIRAKQAHDVTSVQGERHF